MTEIHPRLYSADALQERYKPLSHDGKSTLSIHTLYKWRKVKNFPEPKLKTPRLFWCRDAVHQWEVENGYEFLQAEVTA